jgi:NADH-quinone oxidoreductase chain I
MKDIRKRGYFYKVFIGFISLIKGMMTTIKYLLSKSVTLQYPEERWAMPERSRGRIGLVRDEETGEPKCTGCQNCIGVCPAFCIWVDRERVEDPETGKKKMKMTEFILDMRLCIFCGNCIETCPFDALRVVPEEYEFSTFNEEDLIFDHEMLLKDAREPEFHK